MGFLGVIGRAKKEAGSELTLQFSPAHLLWALGSLSALHGKSFSAELVAQEFPASDTEPPTEATLIQAATRLGFRIRRMELSAAHLSGLPLPLLIQTKASVPVSEELSVAAVPESECLALITVVQSDKAVLVESHPELTHLGRIFSFKCDPC